MSPRSRGRATARALGLGLAVALTASCTGEVALEADPAADVARGAVTQQPPSAGVVLEGSDPAELAVAASQTYFSSAGVVVLTPPDDAAQLRAASIGMALGLPVLVVGEETQEAVTAELERLWTHTVLVTGGAEVPELSADRPFLRAVDAPTDLDALQVVIGRDLAGEVPVPLESGPAALAAAQAPFEWLLLPEGLPADTDGGDGESSQSSDEPADGDERSDGDAMTPPSNLADLPGLPPLLAPERLVSTTLISDGGEGQLAALGTARAAGASVVLTQDVATDPTAIAALFGLAPEHIVGIGDVGDPAAFSYAAAVAVTGVELPGGGQSLVEDKEYVALRGAPGAPELGSLGEQGISETITRLRELAASTSSEATVVPTAVVLATVASAEAGTDGSYSGKRSLDALRPLVEAAHDAGVSVLLTFQTGRQSLLEQVVLYEELLAHPNVGVAVEPAWRLAPGQVPGEAAGQIDAAEINAVVDHLAAFTLERSLPPKMLVVRSASESSLVDPQNVDVGRPQVHVVVEVDGSEVTAPAPLGTPTDPLAPAAVTAADVWAGATAMPFDDGDGRGSWGWAQGPVQVPAGELLGLTPTPLLITYP